jgi:hypothetical protein
VLFGPVRRPGEAVECPSGAGLCCLVLSRPFAECLQIMPIAGRAEGGQAMGVTRAMAARHLLDLGGQHFQHRPQARRQRPKLPGKLLVALVVRRAGPRVMSWGSDDRGRVSYSARCPNLRRASPSPPSTCSATRSGRPSLASCTSRLMTASPYSSPNQARLSTYTVCWRMRGGAARNDT